ncbi:replication-relaxation family protein [Nocardiopsis sp. EMB25]|uniref:replication-relaxation family protein n=1 Tax=Nocardiopsis sp. EMB25 TaxID=2835867 RepID=UPI002283CBC9|nr:replication-relaxation family protein [Nocardiopsis sp. EMB25]MCY9787117.1 replication-relaxation family protein [Nocardiopsis sp. EMB25]
MTDTSALRRLVPRITSRDHAILADLHEHNVMTTHQIHRLHFPERCDRVVRHRMSRLHQYELVDRFRPYSPRGRSPDHWVLSRLGGALVAAHRGGEAEPQDPAVRSDAIALLAHSRQLGHKIGLVDCLVAFTTAARTTTSAQLVCWYGERESARRWGRHIRPDAYVQWGQDGTTLHAFVEYDTGSEPLTKVRRKLPGYAWLAGESGLPSIVLFAVHSAARENNLAVKAAEDASAEVGVYLTTHHQLNHPGPAARIWRGTDGLGRLALLDIARRHPVPEEGDRWSAS